MDKMIYTALSGATQNLSRQGVVAHNLANASTHGFKGQLSMYRAVEVNGQGNHTRSITADTTPSADFSKGIVNHTGRSLDVAIDGDGWLAVATEDGGEGYTRDGSLSQDATGLLTSGGRPVLGAEGQPLVLPLQADITIAADGTISALGAGDQPNTLGQVGQLKLVNPLTETLGRGGDGLFRVRSVDGQPPAPVAADDTVRVTSGALEGSNVSPVGAMVDMIANARAFEMSMKAISTADDNARSANTLLSIS